MTADWQKLTTVNNTPMALNLDRAIEISPYGTGGTMVRFTEGHFIVAKEAFDEVVEKLRLLPTPPRVAPVEPVSG